jgi:hypothetical protein
MADLAQWFVNNPGPAWHKELQVAASTSSELNYRY